MTGLGTDLQRFNFSLCLLYFRVSEAFDARWLAGRFVKMEGKTFV